MSEPPPLVVAAAANNAHWCDAVCHAHNAATSFVDEFWFCATKTPPLYPNLVTLGGSDAAQQAAQRRAIDNLRAYDLSPHWAVKDSFRSLDLTSHGYELLFDAVWIAREPGSPTDRSLSDVSFVTDAAGLADWETAWRCEQEPIDLPRRLFPSHLLADPDADVGFVALRREGRIVAGAAFNCAAGIVGMTNLFTGGERADAAASAIAAAISARFPGLPIVDYETEDRARELADAGFRPIGPLAVWLAL